MPTATAADRGDPPEDALLFAEYLTGDPDAPLRVSLLDLRRDRKGAPRMRSYERAGSVRELHPWIAEHNAQGYCVFAFINEIVDPLPDGREFATNGDVARIRTVCVDGDCEKGFKPEWHLPPSFVCTRHATGRLVGVHAYWLVNLSHDDYRWIQKRLALRYGSDDISDPRRIMRLPGYLHQKNGPAEGYRLMGASDA